MKNIIRTVLLLPVGAAILSAQPTPLRLAVEKAAAALPAGGFVLAEVDGHTVNYTAAGNPSPREDLAPEHIVFEIGSITKVFTGLLLAQAVTEGKAALDDPIAKHLPADLTLDPALAAITLAQLSSHTSGLPRLPDNLAPANPADPYAGYTVERLYDFLRDHHPEKPAPQPSDYSNLGAGLLGHLLERIYGLGYAELVAAKITGPLGMRDTVITLNPGQLARFAPPHSGSVVVSTWVFDALAGAGALRSTAADLVVFARALMNPDSPLAQAWAIARQPIAPHGRHGQMGLGFMLVERNGQVSYSHGGGTGGFRSYFEFIPDTGTATILLLNNDAPEPAAIVFAANRPPVPPTAALSERVETAISPEALQAYTGVFTIDARSRFTVVIDAGGRLKVRLTGQPFLPVFYAGDDRFFVRVVAAEYQFTCEADGSMTTLTLHQNGNQLPAKRTADAPVILFPPVEELKPFTGKYELAPGFIFEVTTRAGHLFVKLTGQPAWPVFCTAPDHFVYDVVEAALTFERDATGAVTAVVLHQHGRDQRAPRRE